MIAFPQTKIEERSLCFLATERGAGSDRRLNVEGRVGGNETSNIEEGAGGECPAVNCREKRRKGDGKVD
jgi:hypothetical protein